MYCGSCGCALSERARFCPNCGAQVVRPASAAGSAPAQQSEADAPAAGAGRQSSGSGAGGPRPASREASSTSAPTPAEAPVRSGFSHLGARIIEFRQTTLAAVPTFALVLLSILLAAGTAFAAYQLATKVIVPAVTSSSERKNERSAAILFSEKCSEYQVTYGKAIASSDSGAVTGLAVVQRLEFDDDGLDELLLVYHDSSNSYTVEIWDYNASKEDIERVCELADPRGVYTNLADGTVELRLCEYEGVYALWCTDGDGTFSLYGLLDSGSYGLICSYTEADDGSWSECVVNGEEAEADEVEATLALWLDDDGEPAQSYVLWGINELDEERASATVEATEAALDELAADAGVSTSSEE